MAQANLCALVKTYHKSGEDPETTLIKIGTHAECVAKMNEILDAHPFRLEWRDEGSGVWEYVDDDDDSLTTCAILHE